MKKTGKMGPKMTFIDGTRTNLNPEAEWNFKNFQAELESMNEGDEEELDFYLQMESEWRKKQTVPTFYEIIKDIPEARGAARRGILARIKTLKEEISYWISLRKPLAEAYGVYVGDAAYREMQEIIDNDIDEKIHKAQQEIKTLSYQKRFLSTDERTVGTSGITDVMVQQAKMFPIRDIVKVNKMGKFECLWHSERTASAHCYSKQNHFYCFSCTKHGDSIDLFMKLNNCEFVEAVKKLTNTI